MKAGRLLVPVPSMVLSMMLSMVMALALLACAHRNPAPGGPGDKPTRVFPGAADIRDSVYQVLDRGEVPPAGYGLYSVVLTRAANRNSLKLLSELFALSGSAGDAALARENLNLMTIPVKDAAEATLAMAAARERPDATASAVLHGLYDYGQAALLLASVCRTERGAAVMKACGSAAVEGPILVTGQRPIDAGAVAGQRLLIVNLGGAPPAAVAEIVAAYRRQILRPDFADRAETEGWRLAVLNAVLDAAHLLPGISKAVAASR